MRALFQMLGVVLAANALAASLPAFAQRYPAKQVRITSPYPTGISPDISARVVAEKLSRYWGQQVLIEARPGGNGFPAFNAVKKATPDGHELLLVGNSHLTINPFLFKNLPYDPEADYAPVTVVYNASFFLWVAANAPYKTVKDLVAAAKADPKKVSYSTPYTGSPPHLGGAMLAQMTGTEMLAVQFKEGPAMFAAVVNGDVTFMVATIGSATPLLKAGRLRGLAVASPQRSAHMPDVPTVREVGGPAGYEVDTWVGLVAPRATPREVVGRVNADVQRALGEPDVRERYRNLGLDIVSVSPEQMAGIVKSELKKNAGVVRSIGIPLQ